MHILVNKNFLTYKNYKVKCAIGKRGINKKKREGDLITPKGTFSIIKVLYRKDRVKGLKTKIPKKVIEKNMGWCDDPRSNKYNQLIKYPFNFNSEKLFRPDNTYDIVLVLNFNMNPIIKNKGSAIFIHIAKEKFNPTKGCIAIKKKDLKEIIKNFDARTKVKIF
ncbi:MAG: L,D-transpeptidase family protein [Pseudomonadota bacterium]|nr:L,D-transpeptidase family protein [Pseudomonadota bacterium]